MSQSQAILFGDGKPAAPSANVGEGTPVDITRTLLERLSRRYRLISVCPEFLGGL